MLPTPDFKVDYDKVYEPSEDSFLVLDSLEKDVDFLRERFHGHLSVVCEIGPGSGIITTFMMQNRIPNGDSNSLYMALDISPWALESTLDTARLNRCGQYLEPIQSDLTTSIRKNEIDLLVFNPPYVPAEEVPAIPETKEETDQWLDLALLGGEDGMVITQKVLDQLDQILSPIGVAYILFCARNKPEEVAQRMTNDGIWKMELVEHRKAGWEVLSVYRIFRDEH